MARDISVELSVEGEKEFNRQLKEAQNAVRVLGSELKASEASFKGGDDAQEKYANRTRILKDQIEQERVIIERLTKAVKTAGDEFGQTDARTDKYRIALNRAKENVAKLEKQLDKTDREMEELGRDSVRVGRQLEDGIGDAADAASDDIKKMIAALTTDISGIKSSVTISAIADVGGALIDAGQAISDFTESTREYRRDMSFLEQNALDAGIEYEEVKKLMFEVAALSGETDSAVEGLSNLLKAGLDLRQLQQVTELLRGVTIALPNMKFENLAESFRETILTGKATGEFGALIENEIGSLDEFNKALEEAQTTAEKTQVAIAYLEENGYGEKAKSYDENNKDMMEAATAALAFSDSIASLSEQVEPVATAFTGLATTVVETIAGIIDESGIVEFTAGVINEINEFIKLTQEKGLLGAITSKQAEEETQKRELARLIDPETVSRVEALEAEIIKLLAQKWEAEQAGNGGLVIDLDRQLDEKNYALTEAYKKLEEDAEKAQGMTEEELAEAAKKAGKEIGEAHIDGEIEAIEENAPKVEEAKAKQTGRWADGIIEEEEKKAEEEAKSIIDIYKELVQGKREAEYNARHEAAATVDGGAELIAELEAKRAQLQTLNKEINALYEQGKNAEAKVKEGEQQKLINEIGELEKAIAELAEKAKPKAKEKGGEAGDEVVKGADEAMKEGMPDVAKNGESAFSTEWAALYENFRTLGGGATIKLASGMLAKVHLIDTAASTLGDRALAQIDKQIARANARPVYRAPTIGGGSGRGGTTATGGVTVALNVDGRQMGKVLVLEMNLQMGGTLNAIANA